MVSTEILHKAIEICEDRKAEDIVTYDVREKSILADFHLLCSGNSKTQVRAILQSLEKSFKDLGIRPRSIEGIPESGWVIMDYNDVLIHIFHNEIRTYYNLEDILDQSMRFSACDNLE